MNQSERPDSQENFAVTGDGCAPSLFGVHVQAWQIQSLYKYIFSLCSMPGPVPGAGDTELSTTRSLLLWGVLLMWGEVIMIKNRT